MSPRASQATPQKNRDPPGTGGVAEVSAKVGMKETPQLMQGTSTFKTFGTSRAAMVDSVVGRRRV